MPHTLKSDKKYLTNGDHWALTNEYYLEIKYTNFNPINVWLQLHNDQILTGCGMNNIPADCERMELHKDENIVSSSRYIVSSSGIQRVIEDKTTVYELVDDNTFKYKNIFATTIESITANQIVLRDTYFDTDTNNQIETPAKVVETPQAKIRSLSTGTIIIRTLRSDGNGELTIKNGMNYDAVAVMTRSYDLNEAVLSVYIRAGNSYTISNIPVGEYYLFYKTGKDWDDSNSRFTMPEESSRFEDKLVYGSSTTGYSATLYSVTGGNAQTESVSEADFPK